MNIPVELLDRALEAYRKELESKLQKDAETIRQQVSTELKAALPSEVQDYLEVITKPDGGLSFLLKIPGCVPLSLCFVRRISGMELKSITVMSDSTGKKWASPNLMVTIGYARELYLRTEGNIGDILTSDIESRLLN